MSPTIDTRIIFALTANCRVLRLPPFTETDQFSASQLSYRPIWWTGLRPWYRTWKNSYWDSASQSKWLKGLDRISESPRPFYDTWASWFRIIDIILEPNCFSHRCIYFRCYLKYNKYWSYFGSLWRSSGACNLYPVAGDHPLGQLAKPGSTWYRKGRILLGEYEFSWCNQRSQIRCPESMNKIYKPFISLNRVQRCSLRVPQFSHTQSCQNQPKGSPLKDPLTEWVTILLCSWYFMWILIEWAQASRG